MLKLENCYLRVTDPWERFMNQLHEADRVIKTIVRMVHCAKIFDLSIIANIQYKKGFGLYVTNL